MENYNIVTGGELQHWKYIKKYRVNGKWRYVYANSGTHSNIKLEQELVDNSLYRAKRLKEDVNYYSDSARSGSNPDAITLRNASRIAAARQYDDARAHGRYLNDLVKNNEATKYTELVSKYNKLKTKARSFINKIIES